MNFSAQTIENYADAKIMKIYYYILYNNHGEMHTNEIFISYNVLGVSV